MKAHGLRRRWTVPIGLGAVVALLVLPANASGATASVAGGTLTFTAASGETNNVVIEPDGAVIRVIDSAVPVTAGGGCMQRSVHRVNCASAGVSLLRVLVFDGDDRAQTLGTTDAELNGGRARTATTPSTPERMVSASPTSSWAPVTAPTR